MARKNDNASNCAPPKASKKNPKGTKPATKKSSGSPSLQKF